LEKKKNTDGANAIGSSSKDSRLKTGKANAIGSSFVAPKKHTNAIGSFATLAPNNNSSPVKKREESINFETNHSQNSEFLLAIPQLGLETAHCLAVASCCQLCRSKDFRIWLRLYIRLATGNSSLTTAIPARCHLCIDRP